MNKNFYLVCLVHDTNISIMPAISNLMQYKNSMCYIIMTSLLEMFRLQDVYYYWTILWLYQWSLNSLLANRWTVFCHHLGTSGSIEWRTEKEAESIRRAEISRDFYSFPPATV